MDRLACRTSSIWRGSPHACGDGPALDSGYPAISGVVPTRVGMDRQRMASS